ncbi:MAG: hypothetical protein VKK04_17410, partial [Synechococcales bacterium]|nr:hypothetical protein [Synechococcales bacterium]
LKLIVEPPLPAKQNRTAGGLSTVTRYKLKNKLTQRKLGTHSGFLGGRKQSFTIAKTSSRLATNCSGLLNLELQRAEGSPAHSYDMQTPYRKLVLGFMGITDLQFVYADNQMDQGEWREKAIAHS